MARTSSTRAKSVREIREALRRYAAATARLDQITAGTVGLTLSTCEANFVNLLRLHGPLTPGELGRLAAFTSSGTTTGVIDRLEKAGYVTRVRSTTDRRKIIVHLREDPFATDEKSRTHRLTRSLADHPDDTLTLLADLLTALTAAETEAADRPAAQRPGNGDSA